MSKMPIIFVGHGSPMNALENNEFVENWIKIAQVIPPPKAILSISAHWYTTSTKLMNTNDPKMIYDMRGFPKELYELEYNVKGSFEYAQITQSLISSKVEIDNTWGIDHGTWSVLCRMYPNADIPVFQLSIDKNKTADMHYQIGNELSSLRDKDVLIFASGNVVHNLFEVNWNMENGYPWAYDFDNYIKNNVLENKFQNVLDYKLAGKSSELAFYTPDHFYPLCYILGAVDSMDTLEIFNDKCVMGSLSMTSYLFK